MGGMRFCEVARYEMAVSLYRIFGHCVSEIYINIKRGYTKKIKVLYDVQIYLEGI